MPQHQGEVTASPPKHRGLSASPKRGQNPPKFVLACRSGTPLQSTTHTRRVPKQREGAGMFPRPQATPSCPRASAYSAVDTPRHLRQKVLAVTHSKPKKTCPAGQAGSTQAARWGAQALARRTSHPAGKSAGEFRAAEKMTPRAKKEKINRRNPPGLMFKQLFSALARFGWLSWPAKTKHVLCKLERFQLRHAVPNGSS